MIGHGASGIATTSSIGEGLRVLGLGGGDIACVHAGMKSLGLVIGGRACHDAPSRQLVRPVLVDWRRRNTTRPEG